MAQSVEHILGKDEVTGSIPVSSSKKKRHDVNRVFSFCVCFRKDTTSFDRLRSTSFSHSLTSFRFSGHKTMWAMPNDVVLRANLCYACATIGTKGKGFSLPFDTFIKYCLSNFLTFFLLLLLQYQVLIFLILLLSLTKDYDICLYLQS